jgi:hypothetical protein
MAIKTSKENEPGKKVVARIVSYVECQLNVFYPEPKIPGCPPPKHKRYDENVLVDFIDSKIILGDLVRLKIITQSDLDLILNKFGENKTFVVLSKELHVTTKTVKIRISKILGKIRKYYCV